MYDKTSNYILFKGKAARNLVPDQHSRNGEQLAERSRGTSPLLLKFRPILKLMQKWQFMAIK